MAPPAFLRYLPARLKPLGSPLVWAPLTAFCLLSVFIWEYRRNPEWSNRQPVTDLDANADGAELTPEEQAGLSEIDTLDVLLEGAKVPGGIPVPAASSSLEPPTEDSSQLTGRPDPFGVYSREYGFPGASGATSGGSTRLATPSASALPGPIRLNSGVQEPSSAATGSALSDALDRQSAQPARSTGSSAESTGVAVGEQPASEALGSQEQPDQTAGNSGSSIPVPYIRTTPNMSPPVGTTGYRPPATSNLPVFNQPLPQPSRNPYSAAPAAPAAQPAPLPGAAPQSGISYTAPSFTQPDQTRRVR
ncbi:MAG: hypothetical protein WBB01_08275 [Phormidesmis sp.]